VNLVDPALVVHLFSTFASDDVAKADAGYAQLHQAWQRLADRLGLAEPPEGVAVPADPPEHRPTGVQTALLAGRGRPGPLCQMWWNHVHDVACLSLAISADGRPDRAWHDLQEQWGNASAGLDLSATLGTAEIYVALTTSNDPVPLDDQTFQLVGANLPFDSVSGWKDGGAATTDGLVVYQVSARHDIGPLRRLAVLAPHGADNELGAWVWQAGLARLSIYLLNSAKLRHQAQAVHDARSAVATLRLQSSQRLNSLQPRLAHDRQNWTPARLVAEKRSLADLQAGVDGLIDTLARVATFHRTIDIAAANMADLARGHVQAQVGSFFDDDQRLARRLGIELDDEHAYLTAASQRAAHFATVFADELSRLNGDAAQAARHRENQFTNLQTLILSTILMVLTAIQAFGFQITAVPQATQAAVITALGAVAFMLYAISLLRADHTQHPGRERLWPAILVTAGAGATAATLGWILGTLLPHLTNTGPLAGIGFLAGGGLAGAVLWSWRRIRSERS
jgi:hypothetical protein